MKLYVIAGEASGDLHGANLVRALRELEPSIEVRALGGDQLAAAGATLVRHNRDLNHFGIVEVLRHLPQILGLFRLIEDDIEAFAPDAVVMIDYPGFNLRLAKTLHARGVRVLYYISPQLWAWKAGRIKTVRAAIERVYCILPFEKAWYAARGVDVDYVGHPLLDAIADWRSRPDTLREDLGLDVRPIVALLPGSRRNEVKLMLPTMLAAVKAQSTSQVILAAAPHLDEAFFAPMIEAAGVKVRIVYGRTYDVLRAARAAIVTSGTATLETALWGVPQVLCYRLNPISYRIGRWLVKLKYVGLPNLIVDRPVIRELLQEELSEANLKDELGRLLDDEVYRARIASDYTDLRHALGDEGASRRTAELILARLRK